MSTEGLIEVLVGEVGSGKTLTAVGQRILPHLARGGVVCTNIELLLYPWSSIGYRKSYPGVIKVLRDRFSWDLQPGQIIQLPRDGFSELHKHIPEGRPDMPVLVVVDEALEYYDSLDRDDNKGRLRDTLSFFRHCRKLRVDLCLILQTFGDLNNRIRTKCTRVWSLRDTNKMRVPVIRCPWPIRNMILCQWWAPKGNELLYQKYFPKYPWAYGCYDTADMSLTDIRCGLGLAGDFRGVGKIKKGDQMKWYERLVLYSSLVFVAYAVFRAPPQTIVYNQAPAAPVVQDPGQLIYSAPTNEVKRVEFAGSFVLDGHETFLVDGRRIREGRRTREGLCLLADENQVIIQRDNGTTLTLYPGEDIRAAVTNNPVPVVRPWPTSS